MNNQSLSHKLEEYSVSDYYPFHMPGHKRNRDILDIVSAYSIDITEIDGFDDLHKADGLIFELMERVSSLFGSKKSYILVNGTTCGILAAVFTVCNEGDTVLIARGCHKSVYNGAYINKLKVKYLYEDVDEYGIKKSISTEVLKDILEGDNSIKAVVITSPTYEGNVSDILSISKICHDRNVKLIVDEAHGAHLRFSDKFPKSAVNLFADIVIQSIHKTLPSVTQTALAHINDLSLKEDFEKYLSIFETSSPSYILMSSIDKCIGLLEEKREVMFSQYLSRLEAFRFKVDHLKNIELYEGFLYDIGKLVIISKYNGYSGKNLYDELLDKYHLQMEMCSKHYVIAMTSVCDIDEGFDRLIKALVEIDMYIEEKIKTESKDDISFEDNLWLNKKVCPKKIYEIYEMDKYAGKKVKLNDSIGCVSKVFAYMYPPGSPVIVPGEVISQEVVNYLTVMKAEGMKIVGIDGGYIEVKE